jgi:hypothetical protein
MGVKTMKKRISLTKKEKDRFKKLNSIHPLHQTPHERYEFYLLLGKKYLSLSKSKSKTLKDRQKKFYKHQGAFAIDHANYLQKKYKLPTIEE